MIAWATMCMALLGAGGVPTLSTFEPDPLPRGSTVTATGTGFLADHTQLAIGGVEQDVVFVDDTSLVFMVAMGTPEGDQPFEVVVDGESLASVTGQVTVVAPVPRMLEAPSEVELGAVAAVRGEFFEAVSAVTLGGVACEITENTGFVLAFRVPTDPAILGSSPLRFASASGFSQRTITVSAPLPEVDALVPNPIAAGNLLTVKGRIVPVGVEVIMGPLPGTALTVLEVRGGAGRSSEVVVFVPTSIGSGARQVIVRAAGRTAAPAGPLTVSPPNPEGPVVEAVYPSKVAAGGEVWVVGTGLEGVDTATHGLTLVAPCTRKLCRLSTAGQATSGQFSVALSGPKGAAIVALEVTDATPVVPVVSSVEPSPAIRGETLTISGERLDTVRSVVIGGVAQSIGFVDTDRVEVTVAATTSLGSEVLFVAGNAGSEPHNIIVLDPLPVADEGPEAVEVADGVEVAPDTRDDTRDEDTHDVSEVAEDTRVTHAPEDSGCGGGGAGLAALFGAMGLAAVNGALGLVFLRVRRRGA